MAFNITQQFSMTQLLFNDFEMLLKYLKWKEINEM